MAEAFRLLGLEKSASTQEVKAAYRELAKKHHPDVNPNDDSASERFKRLTSAYTQALLASSKRERVWSGRSGQSATSGVRGGRQRPAEPINPKRFNEREWMSAHYGAQTQSQYVRNLAREERARRQAGEAAMQWRKARAGGGSFWWVLAGVGVATAVWSAVFRTNVNKFRGERR